MNQIIAIISTVVIGVIGVLFSLLKIKSDKISRLEEENKSLESEKESVKKVNDSSKNYIKKLLEVNDNEKIDSNSDIDSILRSAREYYDRLQDKRKDK